MERSLKEQGGGRASLALPDPLRLVILDSESVLIQALCDRAARRDWETHVLAHRTTRRLLARLRIHALVVNPAVLGPEPWDWIDAMASGLPGLSVVVCAAPSTASERIQALQLGVDDWLEKPCHPDEVIARIESAVRRRRRADCESAPKGPVLAGELEIRFREHQAYVAGVSAELTRREFAVLAAIAAQKGAVVRREMIYLRVWGYSMVRGDRSVDVHVRKIRRKLERVSAEWSYIHTQVRVGYRLHPERSTAPAHTSASPPSR
jgi:DNA-binding response OmpR family regulator